MKVKNILLLLFAINIASAQKIETIKIPKGVVYNYCDNKIIEKTKKMITSNIGNGNDYSLLQKTLIVGPVLWSRFKDYKKIQGIEKGKVSFHVDDLILEGKMSQNLDDSKIIWDEFRKEVTGDYIIRKANEQELKYYWSVISFDIDEPLLIVETKNHNYILNVLKKDLKLMWLDEVPPVNEKPKDLVDSKVKMYRDGKEIDSISKGVKETKLEKIILLNTDAELKENSSIEDISEIMTKTNSIFEELFKNSDKPGKIMVQFELGKIENKIEFAVRDELDLEIMKEFERRINAEKYPIKIQLIYKVNSFDDTE
ncbi:hypothetical protein [Flavobacterium sp. UBA7682]|uniref:hypothetical protein n=1 Tax=Flavobacterium sp. UBA7682 TaxID=1946560 RepID=UPI0025BC4546|nr:hypothetical protein [Flavobacterium sp. UBA7682]